MKKVLDAKLVPTGALIELEPFGVTGGMDRARPVMLFREKDGEGVLPVWLHPLDAGIALSQHNTQSAAMSPHDLTLHALTALKVKPEECHFVELRGHQQYLEIKFSGSKKLKVIKTRADFAVSFCLQAKVKFYCTRDYMARCRVVDEEISRIPVSNRGEIRRNAYLN